MTTSTVRSRTFTIADARYVGAKVGADLRLLNSLYGRPTIDAIDAYVEEIALLLKGGHLSTVDFGFRDAAGNAWKLRLRYRATTDGHLTDDAPGSLPRSADIAGLTFYSYLSYSASFHALPPDERRRIEGTLPFQRMTGAEPSASGGASQGGRGYGRNGGGLSRDIYEAY